MGARSEGRAPSLIILVYPPRRSRYLGAKPVGFFFAQELSDNTERIPRLAARLLSFAFVTSCYTFGLISFAFASVVFIFSFKISARNKERIRATRTFLTLPNFLPFFLCLIPLEIGRRREKRNAFYVMLAYKF